MSHFDYVVLGINHLVDPFHRCHAFRNCIAGFGKILDWIDDAVENDHIINEYGSVHDRLAAQDEQTSEEKYDRDEDSTHEFTDRVGRCLTQ